MSQKALESSYQLCAANNQDHVTINREDLLCPICYNTIYPPARLCPNGHGVCPDCYDLSDKNCAVCRAAMTANRSELMEHIYKNIVVDCKNKDDGCSVRGMGLQIERHQKNCLMGTRLCPKRALGCQWRGPITLVAKHYIDKHASL